VVSRLIAPAVIAGGRIVSMFTFSAAFGRVPACTHHAQDTVSKFTVPIGLSDFIGEHTTAWGPFFAGSVIATIPVVIVFLVTQRWSRSGVSLGGLR
jgi:ABC-type maltose transport system permease subunit